MDPLQLRIFRIFHALGLPSRLLWIIRTLRHAMGFPCLSSRHNSEREGAVSSRLIRVVPFHRLLHTLAAQRGHPPSVRSPLERLHYDDFEQDGQDPNQLPPRKRHPHRRRVRRRLPGNRQFRQILIRTLGER